MMQKLIQLLSAFLGVYVLVLWEGTHHPQRESVGAEHFFEVVAHVGPGSEHYMIVDLYNLLHLVDMGRGRSSHSEAPSA